MKILEWMSRKLCHNTTQLIAVDDYYYHLKPKFGSCRHVKQTHKERFKLRNSFESTTPSGRSVVDKEEEEEEQEAWSDDGIFPGFLAIGTLGLESDPSSTPKFSISVENIITEKEDQVTENELKLINHELEKVLVLTNNSDDSSGRNSNIESNSICPLQGYLLGSAFELLQATTTTRVSLSKNKLEEEEEEQQIQRTSLADLLQRSKVEHQNNLVNNDNEEEANKKKGKKKRMIHSSVDSGDRKLHNKILHMFQKKVHPKKRINDENKEQWIKTDADYLVLEL